nr:MAG TPA: histone-lysine N-methyltransferase [Caudoviricetes sp.]
MPLRPVRVGDGVCSCGQCRARGFLRPLPQCYSPAKPTRETSVQ